jgi:arylsulfate sulfotransferase
MEKHSVMGHFLRCLPAICLAALLGCTAACAQNSSTTALTASPASLSPGGSATLTASVQVASGDPTPTGTVQFTANGNLLAAAALVNGAAQTTASSAGIPPGVYPVIASYAGDANTAPSHSASVPVTVQRYPSTTALTVNPAVVGRGANATANATVTSTSGQPATGTVAFHVGTNDVFTVPLTNGQAVLSGSSAGLAADVYPVTATYSGDAETSGSSSATVNFTVKGVTSTAFTVTPAVLFAGANAVLQVTITGNGGTPATGTVKFYSGSTFLTQAAVTGGAASLQVSTTGYPPGNYSVTAEYLGDAKNLPSSATTQVSVDGTTHAYSITPDGAALAAGASTQFSVPPASGSTVLWYVNGVAGGSSATGAIDSSGQYTAPAAAGPVSVMITAARSSAPNLFSVAVPVYVVVPGTVAASNHPQVAAYTINAPAGGQMSVEFGLTNAYGRNTWQQPTPAGGGPQTMLVAGMTAPATWHMRADVDFGNGILFHDADHAFATTLIFTPIQPTVTQTPGLTPQPGMEVVNTITQDLYVYDLQGNFIWGLPPLPGTGAPSIWQSIKLLPNGHLLTQFSPEATYPVDGTFVPPGTTIAAYELELDRTIVRQMTLAQLNANLAAYGYRDGLGNAVTLTDIHHDISMNPVTGHWIILANTTRVVSNDPGTSGPTTILGDVVLDVDPNNNFAVDWVWNEFDHLDVNRHPHSIQDWTHTNAVIYSATDHNILVSVRYQDWIVKVDYDDAAGSGDILWRFGYQGDFTLVNGTSPQDWQFAQHSPAFTTATTSGVFGLTMMDNGDGRILAAGAACPVALVNGQCDYSRAPQFTVDENAMTATLGYVMPLETYNYFGGNAEVLANGDAHADFCSVPDPNHPTNLVGYMVEYSPGADSQLVWSLDLGGTTDAYRGQRWGSFYPGVTWAQ